MLSFKVWNLRLFCNFTGCASSEIGKEHYVILFKIPLRMSLEGIAAPSGGDVSSAWAGCSVGVYKREFQLDWLFLSIMRSI